MNLLPVPSDDWASALANAQRQGIAVALVTILKAEGSVPRGSGTKMLVAAEGQTGSIGGGHLELKALEQARGLLAGVDATPVVETFALGPSLGQCCGGAVTLLFEPFLARAWNVWIFGAGHVGLALAHQLAGLPVRVTLADSRAAQFLAPLPANCTKLLEPILEDAVKDVPVGADALVMTHSHDLDLALVERLLLRGDLAYVGLIGSASKRKRFESRLADRKIAFDKLVCPIGIAGIADKHPHAIAIAAAADLLVRQSAAKNAAAPGELAALKLPR
jgi:xanthine dehydrogenase accessory factor